MSDVLTEHPEVTAARLRSKSFVATKDNLVDFLVLPNEVFHTITPFVFKCHSFEFQIVFEFTQPNMRMSLPQVWQVRNAFDSFYRDRDLERFRQFGCVFFKCSMLNCDSCVCVSLPQHFLSDELAFQKAYSNFYENFNPSNYIIHV